MRLRNESRAPWVERETLIEASPEEVWEAITDEDRLEEWIAPEVELDAVEGGDATFRYEDGGRPGPGEAGEGGGPSPSPGGRRGGGESRVDSTTAPPPSAPRLTV